MNHEKIGKIKDLVFCDHCNELVSRSTFERHERKRVLETQKQSLIKRTMNPEESDTDTSHGESNDSDMNDDNEMCSTVKSNAIESFNENWEGDYESKENTDTSSENESVDESSSEMEPNSEGVQSSTDEEDSEEVWNDVLPDSLQQDLNEAPPPIPDAKNKEKYINKVNSLVFWMVYFLVIWQLSCHISDNAMAWLLRFLVSWLKIIGIEVSNIFLGQLTSAIPGTLYMLREFIDFNRDEFEKYVVCPKCHNLYKYNECLTIVNHKQVAKTCSGVFYSRGKKKTCGAALVYNIKMSNGKSCFYPIKYYCYNSVINALERLLMQKGFAEKCESWRKRTMPDGDMADVYDGKIWKQFGKFNGKDFLNAPRNYGFMLNFDFFQPMKHRKDYSVGVFYLVILNLPRKERFKWDNVIVIDIVPSLSKEPKNLNPFLEPAVKELQWLWRGIRLKSALSRFSLTFRGAIMSVSSDVPATRKLAGFKSHSASIGCSHCLKSFPGDFGEKRDYSGFDRENWEPRRNDHHRILAKKLEKIKTITKKKAFGRDHGITHYTVLLDLEYFDVIRFFTIDPMHNLFLGTAKTMFNLWIENKFFSKKQLDEIQNRIKSMEVPSNIGRLPMKISSNSGSYTAEQWKNWTLIYSIFCLKNILPESHFKCWQTFVLACKYICKPIISITDINIADKLFLKFCKEVETVYGKNVITPNMHLHCHLKNILIDHGPVASFWCFSFERYNGVLGSTITNKRSVDHELQLMRRFKISHFFQETNLPDLYKEDFLSFCSGIKEDKGAEWVNNSEWKEKFAFQELAVASPLPTGDVWKNQSAVFSPLNFKLSFLDSDDAQLLLQVYKLLYPVYQICMKDLSESIQKFGYITIGVMPFGSKLEPSRLRSAKILASWPSNSGFINKDTFQLSPGTVHYYFTHSCIIRGEYISHTFACVKWNKPDNNSDRIGNPIQVWRSMHQEGGPSSFIPVQRIFSKFASAKLQTTEESDYDCIAVSPIIRKIFL